jgi:hypothetical protein
MTELMRFLREGVTAAWAARGLDRAAPTATVRAAGMTSVCSLFSALQIGGDHLRNCNLNTLKQVMKLHRVAPVSFV